MWIIIMVTAIVSGTACFLLGVFIAAGKVQDLEQQLFEESAKCKHCEIRRRNDDKK